MFRKLSLSLRSKNKEKEEVSANGTSNGVNEVKAVNGKKTFYGAASRKKAASGLSTHDEVPKKQPDHTASRSEVESSFTQFAHLIHAAQRPLPNQSGDGTYIEEKQQHSGLWADLRSLGFRDVKTLTEVMKNTASGALVDDKTMLMERVIQASYILLNPDKLLVSYNIA
jgi:linoleate 10R-lipoxygenase